jgi:hypothetical protein
MGSWFETCMISNLPITDGDKIYMILLTQNAHVAGRLGSSGVHPTDFWFPRSLPILGTYADYGRMDFLPEEELFVQALFAQLQQDVVTVGAGPNEYHDFPVTPDTLTWEALDERLHDARIWVDRNHRSRKKPAIPPNDTWLAEHLAREKLKRETMSREALLVELERKTHSEKQVAAERAFYASVYPGAVENSSPVTRVYIRKDVYDVIQETQTLGYYEGLSAAEFKLQAETLVHEYVKDRRNPKDKTDLIRGSFRMFLAEKDRKNLFAAYMDGNMGTPGGMSGKWVLIEAIEAAIKCPESEAKDKLEQTVLIACRLAEQFVLNAMFDVTRRTWAPTTGTGSQTADWSRSADLHSAFAKIAYEQELADIAQNWHPGSSLSKGEEKYAKEAREEGTARLYEIAKSAGIRRDVLLRKVIARIRAEAPDAVSVAVEKKTLKELRLI